MTRHPDIAVLVRRTLERHVSAAVTIATCADQATLALQDARFDAVIHDRDLAPPTIGSGSPVRIAVGLPEDGSGDPHAIAFAVGLPSAVARALCERLGLPPPGRA